MLCCILPAINVEAEGTCLWRVVTGIYAGSLSSRRGSGVAMGPFRVMDRGWDLEAGDHNLVCFAALSASFIFSVCFFFAMLTFSLIFFL